MNCLRRIPFVLSIAVGLMHASPSHAQRPGGSLVGANAQVTRISGQLVQPPNPTEVTQGRQEHVFQVTAGQLVEARLEADDFDTILQLIPPTGDSLYNDDYESIRTSRILTIATAGGEWRAIVSSYDHTGGDYELVVSLGSPERIRALTGNLSAATPMSAKGQHFERHSYVVEEPSQLFLQLASDDFEPELILHSPSGEVIMQNYDGSSANTVTASVALAEPGPWEIIATHSAYAFQSTGDYSIQIVETEPVVLTEDNVVRGRLQETDPREIHGEFYHTHTIPGSSDTGMTLVLESDDFDAYLAVRSPAGGWYRDDDSAGQGNAQLTLPAESGDWFVIVTSYGPDQVGDYELKSYR